MTEPRLAQFFAARRLPAWEGGLAVLATLAALHLHWICLQHAGALWRDEVAITQLATLPSLGEMWEMLPHDHCPIFFPALIRIWNAAGFAHTDFGLRLLGLGLGLLLLGAFWGASRTMWRGFPLLSLSLVALNVTAIRAGDSLRAYGLGTACVLLTMALTWRYVEAPNLRRGLVAGAAAVVSVQALYQNAFLVLAICLAGFAVSATQRRWNPALGVLGIGIAAALSLTPYLQPIRHSQAWWLISQPPFNPAVLGQQISSAAGFPLPAFEYLWICLILLAALLAAGRVPRHHKGAGASPANNLVLFAGMALVAGLAGFALFIALARLPTQPWYYIPLMGFAGICCDGVLAQANRPVRIGVLGAALMTALLAYPTARPALHDRQTNGDLVAAQVSREAAPGDLIIVHPWYLGLTFNRYYHGAAAWATLPQLDDYRFHRYDLLKPKLQALNPIQPVLDQVAVKLESGHRVWIVGSIYVPQPGEAEPADLPPAPGGPQGWYDEPYTLNWGAKLGYLFVHHITNAVALVNPSTNQVCPQENMALIVVSGWRGSQRTSPR